MLTGLLWLILYDSAFVTIYIGWMWGVGFFFLAPVSYLLVQFMRAWARIVLATHQPDFKRIRTVI